jgi:hypothetical protein
LKTRLVDRDAFPVFRFLILKILKFQPWIGFRFLKIPKRTVGVVMSGFAMKTAGCSLTGIPRDEVVRRGLIRGEIPIYGTAGFAAARSRAMQREGDK